MTTSERRDPRGRTRPTPVSTPAGPLTVAMTVEQLWQPAPGGSGTYIAELALALAQRSDVTLTGLAARRSGTPALPLPASMDVHHAGLPRKVLYELWGRRRRHGALPTHDGTTDGPGSVLHATTWAIPPRTAPLVVTVHDLAFLRDPSHFTTRGNAFFRRALRIVRDEADVVIVPSATTADDCVAEGIERDRIRVIHHGVRAPQVTAAEQAEFVASHGLTRPYLLWCGTIEPRKNVSALLDAYAQLLADGDPGLDLVLVGPAGWGGAAAELSARADRLPAGRVHLLGRLSGAELHRAYAGARAFCFPSLWEGFGMPVLEAMAHGIPAVTSRGTSMAEISPGGAVLIDPRSVDDLVGGLREAVGPRHAELSVQAIENAARFTWERSAELHVEAYRAALAAAR